MKRSYWSSHSVLLKLSLSNFFSCINSCELLLLSSYSSKLENRKENDQRKFSSYLMGSRRFVPQQVFARDSQKYSTSIFTCYNFLVVRFSLGDWNVSCVSFIKWAFCFTETGGFRLWQFGREISCCRRLIISELRGAFTGWSCEAHRGDKFGCIGDKECVIEVCQNRMFSRQLFRQLNTSLSTLADSGKLQGIWKSLMQA